MIFTFLRKQARYKKYGLYGCIYVKFKNRPNWFMVIEIRIVVTIFGDIDWERA